MQKYSTNQVLRIAKRYNNTKRTFLLVNPLQAKHMPVSPKDALHMMGTLGEILKEKYPDTKLVIGFAETATAIGAAVAQAFGDDCVYMHTTRETISQGKEWIYFLEEHSHAVEQKLSNDQLPEYVDATANIIFVDDEISTGKTLINMVNQLRTQYGEFAHVNFIAASIINRVSDENMEKLSQAGITCEYLVKLPDCDYTEEVDSISVEAPEGLMNTEETVSYKQVTASNQLLNPRLGLHMQTYEENCIAFSKEVIGELKASIANADKILILGTEECMFPALMLGKQMEEQGQWNRIFCHATTRSPIGIHHEAEYPIHEGYQICSFYEKERETYIYNLDYYDAVIIVTDSKEDCTLAMNSLGKALSHHNCGSLYLVRG